MSSSVDPLSVLTAERYTVQGLLNAREELIRLNHTRENRTAEIRILAYRFLFVNQPSEAQKTFELFNLSTRPDCTQLGAQIQLEMARAKRAAAESNALCDAFAKMGLNGSFETTAKKIEAIKNFLNWGMLQEAKLALSKAHAATTNPNDIVLLSKIDREVSEFEEKSKELKSRYGVAHDEIRKVLNRNISIRTHSDKFRLAKELLENGYVDLVDKHILPLIPSNPSTDKLKQELVAKVSGLQLKIQADIKQTLVEQQRVATATRAAIDKAAQEHEMRLKEEMAAKAREAAAKQCAEIDAKHHPELRMLNSWHCILQRPMHEQIPLKFQLAREFMRMDCLKDAAGVVRSITILNKETAEERAQFLNAIKTEIEKHGKECQSILERSSEEMNEPISLGLNNALRQIKSAVNDIWRNAQRSVASIDLRKEFLDALSQIRNDICSFLEEPPKQMQITIPRGSQFDPIRGECELVQAILHNVFFNPQLQEKLAKSVHECFSEFNFEPPVTSRPTSGPSSSYSSLRINVDDLSMHD